MDDNQFFTSFYLSKKHKQLVCKNPKKAFIQYKDFRINLLSGERLKSGIEDFKKQLNEISINKEFKQPVVIHLFYEFGFTCNELDQIIDKNKPVAIYIEYSESSEEEIYKIEYEESFKFEPLSLSLIHI